MDKIVFGSFTMRDVLIGAAVVVGALILICVARKIFGGKQQDSHHQLVRCQGCGWQGQVSKFAGRCPKCGKPLGNRQVEHSGK